MLLLSPLPILEYGPEQIAFRVVVEEQQQGQSDRPLTQIAPDGLPHLFLVADEVQDIIHDLKSHAQVAAIVTKQLNGGCWRPAKQRPGFRRSGEQ